MKTKRFGRGYLSTSQTLERLREDGCFATSLPRSIGTAIADYVLIFLLAITGLISWSVWWPIALGIQAVVFLRIAFHLRGLECLIHEGSHHNWCRTSHTANDWLTNLLAAFPLFSTVQGFRIAHRLHHNDFGSHQDPDLRRYHKGGIERLDRSGLFPFLKGVAGRIPGYVFGWWQAIGTNWRALVGGLAWHSLIILTIGAVTTPATAILCWFLYYLIPFLFFLPLIRLVGEAAKHTYAGHETVFDATVSNIGWAHRWFIHPHNDGYHLLHHLYESIPHHQLQRAHQMLERLDPDGYAGRHRHRTRVLQLPITIQQCGNGRI